MSLDVFPLSQSKDDYGKVNIGLYWLVLQCKADFPVLCSYSIVQIVYWKYTKDLFTLEVEGFTRLWVLARRARMA